MRMRVGTECVQTYSPNLLVLLEIKKNKLVLLLNAMITETEFFSNLFLIVTKDLFMSNPND